MFRIKHFLFFIFAVSTLLGEVDEPEDFKGHVINFENVSIHEFIRFVSKIAGANFVYNDKLFDFNVTLISGKPTSSERVLSMLLKMLEQHNLAVEDHENYYLIQEPKKPTIPEAPPVESLIASASANPIPPGLGEFFDGLHKEKEKFFVYKLQYHEGAEIQQAIKQVAAEPGGNASPKLMHAVASMQWIKATNSLLYSGEQESIDELSQLIKTLDIPQKQVFIEVLVIETNVKDSLDFGLEWSGSGKYKDKVGFGGGNFIPGHSKSPFANAMGEIGSARTPAGASDFNLGRGFDLGIIGDIILHRGKTFLTLGTLVSALQLEGDSTIILNQKLITQDNKSSRIFVGDNIPFTGSVVQTVGASQQTTSNVEYRDVGVSLHITPLLGDKDVITLEILEEISEATDHGFHGANQAAGIQTTKTNMLTRAHVPDQHFLVVSGMMRNTKKKKKSGIPCLGSLPMIGAAFSKNETDNEKRNVLVFVRPQIINSVEQHEQITAYQQQIFENQAPSKEAFNRAIDLVNPKDTHDN